MKSHIVGVRKNMTTLYIDTNILLNIIKDETNPYGKDLAQPASRLLFDALGCKYTLLISSWTIEEVLRKISADHIQMTMTILKPKIKQCKYTSQDRKSAQIRSPDNSSDALHIVIAENEKADYIITRNVDDFLKIGTKIPIRKPELI